MFDELFASVSEASGTPVDYCKLFTLFLVSYPLSVPLSGLPPTLKHVTNVVVTTVYLYGVLALKWSFAQILANCLATYYMTYANVGGKRNMPWYVFAFQMAHLTVNHLVRAFGNIPLTTIEITAMQMVLCMNLTSFAWSVHDGKNKTADQCDEQQRSMRITEAEFPTLLEFLGYAFYFPGVLVGPSTRYTDYRDWATGAIYKTKDGKPPAGRLLTGTIELLKGLAFMAVWATYSPKYFYEAFITPVDDPTSALRFGFAGRIAYVFIVGIVARFKYYGIWTLTNGACIVSGLSYNGTRPDGSTRWDRCKNINVLGVEFANNWKELLAAWNMNTNVWLRNNVYKRIARAGKKPGFKSTMATFLTSAFWHGVAPGYYFTFVLGGLLQSVGRSARSHFRPLVFKDVRSPNPTPSMLKNFSALQLAYCAVCIFLTQLTMDFAVLPFMLLEVKKSWTGWRELYFFGIGAAVIPMIAFRLGAGRALDKVTGVAAAKKRAKADAASSVNGRKSNGATSNPQVPDIDVVEKKAVEVGQEVSETIEGTMKKSQ